VKHPAVTVTSVTPPPPTREQQTAEDVPPTAEECSNSDELSTNAPTSSGTADCENGADLEVTTDANIEGKYINFVICYAKCCPMEVVAQNDTFLQFKSFDKSTFVFTVDELATIEHIERKSSLTAGLKIAPRNKVPKPIQGPVMPIPVVRSIKRSARDKRLADDSETDSAEETESSTADEDSGSLTSAAAEVPASDISSKVSTAGMLNAFFWKIDLLIIPRRCVT
jgi:hypothetical protein